MAFVLQCESLCLGFILPSVTISLYKIIHIVVDFVLSEDRGAALLGRASVMTAPHVLVITTICDRRNEQGHDRAAYGSVHICHPGPRHEAARGGLSS